MHTTYGHREKENQSYDFLSESIKTESISCQQMIAEIDKVVIGQKNIVELLLVAALSNGHVLLEGVPGVAKTTLARIMAQALGLEHKRIQFTPDLLPSDLLGTLIYNQKLLEFEVKKGPMFTHFVIADEINRAPAKVQAALLEAMQERQVTLGTETYKLEDPFLVFATQNPIEQEGTYRLPEAQKDRFLFNIVMKYPSLMEEKRIIFASEFSGFDAPLVDRLFIPRARELIQKIHVDQKVIDYIVDIVVATREPGKYGLPQLKTFVSSGASPRATIGLYRAAKANAFLHGRHFVIPEDVRMIVMHLLNHRITLNYEADMSGITVHRFVEMIIGAIHAP